MHRCSLILTLCVVAVVSRTAVCDDDFTSRIILPPGVSTYSDTIQGGAMMSGPDTTLGAFDEYGSLFAVDDDGSHLGGFGSGLYGVPVNADGSLSLAISGYDDMDFDGLGDMTGLPHGQSGEFMIYIDVYDQSSTPIELAHFLIDLEPGAVESVWANPGEFDPTCWFDAYIDTSLYVAGLDEIDFVTFTGLTPGDPFVAEITDGTFDTMLGWYDDAGGLISWDDDGGGGLLSRIDGTVPASGVVNLAVTSYDYYFGGCSNGSGVYTLGLTPEPTMVALLATGTLALLRRRQR